MAKAARRYEIFLPLTYNDGRPIETEKFKPVEELVRKRFGGLTAHEREFPLRGIWQDKNRVYTDRVIVINCIDFRPRGSTRFITQLKKQLLRDFKQLEILITEAPLRIH